MLVELLRPCGADLARRWLGALLLAPESDRADIVATIERRMLETYPPPPGSLRVHSTPTDRNGVNEVVVRELERAAPDRRRPKARKKGA